MAQAAIVLLERALAIISLKEKGVGGDVVECCALQRINGKKRFSFVLLVALANSFFEGLP
eukprot:4465601-Amphidinium_carterae.1